MFKKYVLCLVILGLASSIWTVQNFDQHYPKPLGPHFDADMKTTYLREIRNQQPGIILLGDSTLDRGVDVPQLTETLGKSVYKLGIDGSASAVWYLALKNSILESSHHSPYLVLFFRGTLLTRPADRVTGRYFSILDELADDDEHLIMQLSYIQEMNPFQRFLDQYLPLYGDRTLLKDDIERASRYMTTSRLLNCDRDCTNLALASVFKNPNLRPEAAQRSLIDAEVGLYGSGNEDFSSQVERSYLVCVRRMRFS